MPAVLRGNLGKPFTRPAGFYARQLIAGNVGLYGGSEPEPIRLRLDRTAARWFEESPLPATQQIAPLHVGT